MKEIRKEVRTFQATMQCLCGGNMKFEGVVLTSNPPKYPLKCESCFLKANLDKSYPCLVTEVVAAHKD